MTIECYVWLAVLTVAETYHIFRTRRLEEKLEGKANKKKSRPQAKRVPALQRFTEDEAGNEIVKYICSHCNCDPVPKIGHTVKQCEAAK